jgi:hypothetical protein
MPSIPPTPSQPPQTTAVDDWLKNMFARMQEKWNAPPTNPMFPPGS